MCSSQLVETKKGHDKVKVNGLLEAETEYEDEVDAMGADIRYILPRPGSTKETVGWTVRAFVEVGMVEDDDGNEDAEHDWVQGVVFEVGKSAEDEDDEVCKVRGEDGEVYECDTGEELDVQFLRKGGV